MVDFRFRSSFKTWLLSWFFWRLSSAKTVLEVEKKPPFFKQTDSKRIEWKTKQGGRLPPAYFSQEYKYFDQHLPAVKNETTVYLVYESFLQTSIPPLISIFYAKEEVSRLFVQIFFVSQYRKISLGNTSVYQKISGIEKFYASEGGWGYHLSPSKTFVPHYQKISLGNSSMFEKISCIAKFYA